VANGTGQLTLESAGALDNRGGTLGSTGGALTLTAGSVDNRAEGGQAKLVAGTDLRLQTASLDNAGSMVHAANTLHRSAQAHRYSTLVASSAQATCCAWILPRWTTATAGCSSPEPADAGQPYQWWRNQRL
jgi:adhesin HecA-like repeat protein